MTSDQYHQYSESSFLVHEATDRHGNLIGEVWEAVVAREVVIDEIIDSSISDVGSLEESGLSKRLTEAIHSVRELQKLYGIEQK